MLAALGMLGVLALGPSPGDASSDHGRTGVLPLRAEGSVPEHRLANLEQTIVKGMRLGSFDVIEPAEVADAVPRAGCKNAPCLAGVAGTIGARYLVRTVVEGRQSDLIFHLELIDGQSGEVIARADQACEICSDHEAEVTARGLGATLGRTLEANSRAEPTLVINSTPRGAMVLLDGEDVGSTPLRLPVAPGEHTIEVSAPSRQPQTRRVELEAGVEQTLTFELSKQASSGARRFPAWPGWALVAGGVGALGAGGGLLAIHQRPIRSDCSGENVDYQGDCKYRYNTVAGGATLLAGGVAAIAGGIALVVLHRRSSSDNEQVRVGPGPAGLRVSF